MIVRNEEQHLAACLDSVRELQPELIIVDTGSTDATPDIARQYGAQVVPFDFNYVDFSAARNHGLKHAQANWILVLDADEVLDARAARTMSLLIKREDNAGYFLERHNLLNGVSTVDQVVRVFPNRANYRYRGRVHETIDASILAGGGILLESGMRIDHNFASGRESRCRKNHWYIDILKQEIAADPSDDSRLDFLAAEYHQLEMFDEAAQVAEEIARRRPLDARAHLFAGTYHLLFKPDFIQARKDFTQALSLRPNYPEAQSFIRLLDEKEAG
jgi:glycosyltransferase involved in cell wall biosynthesis